MRHHALISSNTFLNEWSWLQNGYFPYEDSIVPSIGIPVIKIAAVSNKRTQMSTTRKFNHIIHDSFIFDKIVAVATHVRFVQKVGTAE